MSVYVQSVPASPIYSAEPNHYLFHSPPPPPLPSSGARSSHHARQRASKHRFYAELSQCLFDFVIQLLPTREELSIKEDVRRLLERLIRTIEPESRLLSFGSTANGFALKNSDMDLCCLIDSEERLAATDLVSMLGNLLERETKFQVKPLPHARIPIVKLSLDPSPGLPYGIACDIGFENRLALENTRLLMSYAMIDPARVRTMVLFLKVWSKRRKINSPYKGTLSSYGYVLMVLYFLVHVKNPPVLPNLQQIPPLRPISPEEMRLDEHNIWFFDDIELLRQRWQSANTETVAELLADFFKYYSRDFSYNTAVISLRAGAMRKEVKGWQSPLDRGKYNDPRERNRFCIEDPFETDFNVARCVSKDGLYLIRGEFMRASRVFQSRPDRAVLALSQLCEERVEQEDNIPMGGVTYIPSRLNPLPPQTPYTVSSSSLRPQTVPTARTETTPAATNVDNQQTTLTENKTASASNVIPSNPPPPEHMVPTRSKWTSPPPAEASMADRALFDDRFGQGLALATASTSAREPEHTYASSASNSEILTDDGRISDIADLDDVRSVQSFTEESPSHRQWSPQVPALRPAAIAYSYSQDASFDSRQPSASVTASLGQPGATRARGVGGLRAAIHQRGRRIGKIVEDREATPSPAPLALPNIDPLSNSTVRRSISGPPRTMAHRYSMPSLESLAPSPATVSHPRTAYVHSTSSSTIFYETGTVAKERHSEFPLVEHEEHSFVAPVAQQPVSNAAYSYPHHLMDPRLFSPASPVSSSPTTIAPIPGWSSPLASRSQLATFANGAAQRTGNLGPKTPTPGSAANSPTRNDSSAVGGNNSSNGNSMRRKPSHTHTHSTATVVGPVRNEDTPPPLPSPKPSLSRRSTSRSISRPNSRARLCASASPMATPPSSASSVNGRFSEISEPRLPNSTIAMPLIQTPPDDICLENPKGTSALRRAGSPSSPGTDSPAPSSPNSSSYRSSPPSTSPPSPMQESAPAPRSPKVCDVTSSEIPAPSSIHSAQEDELAQAVDKLTLGR